MEKHIEDRFLSWIKTTRVRIWGSAIILVLFLMLESEYDPFGLASANDKISGLVMSSLLSPFYGSITNVDDTEGSEKLTRLGRDSIVVVLYDDTYLKSFSGNEWPIPIENHLALIHRLAGAGAKGIFLDVFFTSATEERRKDLGRLYEDIVDYQGMCEDEDGSQIQDCGSTEIILASLLDNPIYEFEEHAPRSHTSDSKVAEDVVEESKKLAPESALAEVNQDSYLYRLTDCAARQENKFCKKTHDGKADSDARNIATPTAGYKLYQVWCQDNPLCTEQLNDDWNETLYLQWGYAPNSTMAAYYESFSSEDQPIVCQEDVQRLRAIKDSVFSLLPRLAFSNKPNCLYHTNVSAAHAMTTSFSELKSMVGGKIVLIGTNIKAYPDLIESHVHGQVPGVFWHATALDNLIEYQDEFLRDAPRSTSFFLELLFASLTFSLYAYMSLRESQFEERLIDRRKKKKKKKNRALSDREKTQLAEIRMASGAMIILFMSLLLVFMWIVRNYTPENWAGVAALLLIISSQPLAALGFFSGRGATVLIHFGRTKFARTLDRLALKSSKLMQNTGFLSNPRTVSWICSPIRLMLFVSLTLAQFAFLIMGGLALFLTPVIYFSVNESSLITYFLFAVLYTALIARLFFFWRKKTSLGGEKKCLPT